MFFVHLYKFTFILCGKFLQRTFVFFGNIFWDYFLNKKVKQEDDNEKEVSMGSPQQIITKQAVLQKELENFGE